MRATCGCAEAHICASVCTHPGVCRGTLHHIAEHMSTRPPAEVEAELSVLAAEEGAAAVAEAKRAYLAGVAGGRCPPNCRCSCHLCTEQCFDEERRIRDACIAGPTVLLFSTRTRCVFRKDEGVEVRSQPELCGELRVATEAYALPEHATSHGVTPPPLGAALRAVRVSYRVEKGDYAFDTLVVDAGSDWSALMVQTSEGPALFATPGDTARADAFASYRGYVAFVKEYGRRPYSRACREQQEVVRRLLDRLWDEATRHEAHSLCDRVNKRRRQNDVADVETMIRTPRLVTLGLPLRHVPPVSSTRLYVRRLHDYGMRLLAPPEEVHAEIGRILMAARAPAEAFAKAGDPIAALGIFEDVCHRGGTALEADAERKRRGIA